MRNFNNIFVDNNTDFRINSESSYKQNNERFFHFKTSCYSNCVFLVMSVLAKDNIIRCCEYFIEFSGVVSTLFIICNSISLNATVEETNFSDNLSLSNKIDNIISVSLLIFLFNNFFGEKFFTLVSADFSDSLDYFLFDNALAAGILVTTLPIKFI